MAWATRLLAVTYAGIALLLLAGFTRVLDGVPGVAAVGLLVCAALQLLAMWMLARRSGHWSEPPARFNRLALSIVPLAPLTADSIALYLEGRPVAGAPQWLTTIMLATMCGWVVAPPLVFFRIRAVARLLADTRLARQSAVASWGLLLALLTMASGIAVMMALSFNPLENLAATIASFAVMGVVLLFLLWGAFVMLLCVRDFGRAARVARQAERTAEPP